ncbi:SMP-30/gluconolactonase/LRE family protein [Muricomes intestini]|uniref:SMP-30/gluconolactonase/LRE family protein n=1 Tax=Muricomes intestini TaxID=1796634 RepID=UPI002FE21984
MKVERFVTNTMVLGECPVWDERTKTLYWIDITAGQVWGSTSENQATMVSSFDQNVGACCLTKGDGLLVALEKKIIILDNNKQQVIVDGVEDQLQQNRFNDGKCDPRGRLIIGTMNKNVVPQAGNLYQISPEGDTNVLVEGVTISNGLDWSPDGKYLYYIDTPTGTLWRFLYDEETGTLHDRTPFIDYTQEEGNFDGMCVDADGCIWACHWGGFQVTQWDVQSRKKMQTIQLPVPNVTSCCFGGDNLNQLFITTGTGRDESVKRDYPQSGSLYTILTNTRGLPARRFGQ